MFDRETFFDCVRQTLFSGHLGQDQVDGMDTILSVWEKYVDGEDPRWLAYMLATTYHETSQEMLPIEEYGYGAGQPYGVEDPDTGQTYYGRGFVQLTWRENYARADDELNLEGSESCEWHAEQALVPWTAARIMYKGMYEGWFRDAKLEDYFSASADDAFGAREIINGDKNIVPSWSNGKSIGQLIEHYHEMFLDALETSETDTLPLPEPLEALEVAIRAPEGVQVHVTLNGKDL